jgi:hypothetical protein
MTARHFPAPWTAEACFIVRDANRQAVAYVYYFHEESGTAQTANLRAEVDKSWRARIT